MSTVCSILSSCARFSKERCAFRPLVARLVADKAGEIDLLNRLSLYYDDELDEAARAEIERLIDRDQHVAEVGCRHASRRRPAAGGASAGPGTGLNPTLMSRRSDELSRAHRTRVTPIVRFSALILHATGAAIDEKTQALLEKTIADYVDGALDRRAKRGLEAAMRLSPSLARLIADKIAVRRAHRWSAK